MNSLDIFMKVVTHDHFMFVMMMLLGGIVHLFGTLMEQSAELGRRMTIKQYRKKFPYQLMFGFLAAVTCYLVVWKMGELNAVAALGCGYMGDSIIKKKMALV